MDLIRFCQNGLERIREDGKEGLWETVYQFYYGIWVNSTKLYDPGRSIWEREWDILLVLDACRPDLLAEVVDEYDFISSQMSVLSNASASGEWLRKNFDEKYHSYLNETAYISGNPHTDTDLNSADELLLLDEVWKYRWDKSLGTIPPRALTDRAISVGRDLNPDRMIVHYMQPHFPSIPHPELESKMPVSEESPTGPWDSVWYELRHGRGEKQAVWGAYRDNLRYVLDDVSLLLENIDAERVVLTADHGNAIGEYGIYGHPNGVPIKALREVPWVVTSATDEESYVPDSAESTKVHTDRWTVEDRLSDLGYL